MRKIGIIMVIAAMVPAMAVPAWASDAPDTSAQAYIVVEAESGRTLAEKDADEPMLIASTTKIMTALLALEACDPDAVVTVKPEWTGIEGSSMYLAPGQELTVRELLYGLMLASGNDAAEALACLAAGSVEAFADRMNGRAAELGCGNTHFSNPSGLDAEDHYSTARDLAAITAEAIRNETFRDIVSRTSAAVGENTYYNHNRLLTSCPGVFGVKTGYTLAAGRTLVSACERDGVTLICVTLDDPDDWDDHAALYDWAYSQFGTKTLLEGERWTIPVIGGGAESVSVVPAEPLTVTLGPGQEASVVVCLPAFSYAAIEAGSSAGRAEAYVDGALAAETELVYTEDIPRRESAAPTFMDRVRAIFGRGEGEIYTLQ